MTYTPAKFEASMSNRLGGYVFTRNIWFDLDGHMKHCPLHHVTYVPAKFEVATANGQGGALPRKYIIWPWTQGEGGQGHIKCCPVPSTSCDVCTSKVWCCYIPWLRRRCIYKKIHYLTLTLGSRSHKYFPVSSTSYDLWTRKVWYCYIPQLRRRWIYKKIHHLTFGSRSREMLPSTLHIMWPIQLQNLKLLSLTV